MSQSRSLRRAARRRARRRKRTPQGPDSRRSPALAALTGSALALSGLAGSASAESPNNRYVGEYSYNYYKEDSLSSSKVAAGNETQRYEIQSHQVHLAAPLFERMDLAVDIAYETMSGATPWFVEPGPEGEPVQVMSGATIQEDRTDALLTGNYYFDHGKLTAATGVSVESDYWSVNGSLGGERSFNQKNTTLGLGAGFSVDTLEPTDADEYATRPSEEDKASGTAFLSLSQVLSRSAIVQSSAAYQYSNGFLSDPYKLVSVEGANVADSRPDQRHQFSLLTRYRQHVAALNASLHADYRFYIDDWDITSHTMEVAWYQTLWDVFRLIPSFRYYSQSQAEFYAPYFVVAPSSGHASSDYRLSPYGAISWRIKAEADLRDLPRESGLDWKIGFAWERYISDGDFALGKVSVENPGLVSFNLFTVSLSGKF